MFNCLKRKTSGTSLVVQWLRIHLPMYCIDTGSIPSLGRSHMTQGNQACAPQVLSLSSATEATAWDAHALPRAASKVPVWRWILNVAKNKSIHICGCLVTKSDLTLATPWTVARQAPLSIGFSRQKYWRGLPFPKPQPRPPKTPLPNMPTSLQNPHLKHQKEEGERSPFLKRNFLRHLRSEQSWDACGDQPSTWEASCPQNSLAGWPHHGTGNRSLARDRAHLPGWDGGDWGGHCPRAHPPAGQLRAAQGAGRHFPPRSLGFCFPGQCCHLLEAKYWTNWAHSQLREEAGVDRGEANYQRQGTVHTGVFTKQPLEWILPHLHWSSRARTQNISQEPGPGPLGAGVLVWWDSPRPTKWGS